MTGSSLDPSSLDPAAYWEDLYADSKWSGSVNAALEREVAALTPGTALDLGCGEGGDALWLAAHGWSVTAVDISARALARGAKQAERSGLASAVRWVEADLATWRPEGMFDLVASSFLHSPIEFPRTQVLRAAAAAVAAGGVLLVIGHGEPPPWSEHRHDHMAMPTPDDVLGELALDLTAWEVETSAMVARAAVGADGQEATLRDSVLRLRRRV